MNALIIGSTGLIGRRLSRAFSQRGWNVLGTAQQSQHETLQSYLIERDDLRKRPDLTGGQDVALLCAAISDIDACKREPERSRSVNVTGAINAIRVLRDAGIRPVFFSSDYVFSGRAAPYGENDATDPITEYGRQKAEVEDFMAGNVPNGLVIRLSRVVSEDPVDATLFSAWHQDLRAGRTVRLASDQCFTPVSAGDVAEGVVHLVERDACGLFHLCQPERFSRESLFRLFASALGYTSPRYELAPTSAFGFLDDRSSDTSLLPDRCLALTGLAPESMADVSERFAIQMRDAFQQG